MSQNKSENREGESDHLVIVGGGFAGVTLAQKAENLLSRSVKITVISRENHLVFTPMLPEVVSRSLSIDHVAVPGRSITRRTTWIEGNALTIDEKRQTIEYETAQGAISHLRYTHLVVACGSEAMLDSIPGLKAYGLAVKTAGDAILLGNELIARFEAAAAQPDESERQALLHAVVIGGGFSGVEVAGQINDLMLKQVHSYPEIGATKPRVTIVQRGTRVLPEFSHDSLSNFTLQKLRKAGVEVRLETSARELTETGVLLESGERIPTRLVICTIGTRTAPLITQLGMSLEKGRIKTDPDMRATGYRNIWAIGDCAVTTNGFDGKPTQPTAQFALREAAQLAKNIARELNGEDTQPFRFRPQGLLASIGNKNGVAEIFGLQFSGIFAWILWRAVYLSKIPGLSSKIGVALDWFSSATFPPPIAKIRMPGYPQPRRAHYAQGDVVFDNAHTGKQVRFIENGNAGLYFGTSKSPAAEFRKGDYVADSIFRQSEGDPSIRVKAVTPLDVVEVDGRAFAEFAESFGPLKNYLNRALKSRTILGTLLREQSSNEVLGRVTVGEVMQAPVDVLVTSTTLEEALRLFDERRPGFWVTDNDQRLAGYLGRIELYDGLASLPGQTEIACMLRENLQSVSVGQDLFSATASLLRDGLDNIPVLDNQGRLAGLYDPLALIKGLASRRSVGAANTSK